MAKNPPDRIGALPTQGGAVSAWLEQGAQALMAERGRWLLWLPVLMGSGIGLFLVWTADPPWWSGPLVLVLGLALTGMAVARGRAALFLPLAIVTAVAAGHSAIQFRAWRVAAPVLERYTGALMLEGIVEEVEMLPDGGVRATFGAVALDDPGVVVPARVRLRFKPSLGEVEMGAHVRVRAMLMPPPQPAMPGAFDFARFAWFKGLGAVGTALGPAQRLDEGTSPGLHAAWTAAVNGVRHTLSQRIQAVLPGDRGAVSVALVTGDQMPISGTMMQAYRDSGLAHILSISGLHITLAAGLVFVGLRTFLALFPSVALTRPIKKWAAFGAILFAWGYTLLAGSPVPAVRSFAMTTLIMVAVMLDRAALSMRLVAWAALAILLLWPEELAGPSFQMSFAAVVALIAAYEVLTPRQAAWRAARPGVLHGSGLYLFGVVMSTLIAGTATAVYGVYHFNRFAVWSVAANMVAVPLTGFWVMPWALLLFLLLPLGLEKLALIPMGWGVEAVNRVAVEVASWPLAAVTVPVIPPWGLVMFTLGGCWLCLWRGRWRLWGMGAMALGLGSGLFVTAPHLLVDGRGDAMAVRTLDGTLLLNGKGGRILKETWTRRAGPEAKERWPKKSSSRDGRLRCDELGCLWRAEGRVVALILGEDATEESCRGADVVISRVPLRGTCRGARLVVDRFDLWRRGPHALWMEPGGVRVETVASGQGRRPWSWTPHPRKKKTPALEATAEPKQGGDDD